MIFQWFFIDLTYKNHWFFNDFCRFFGPKSPQNGLKIGPSSLQERIYVKVSEVYENGTPHTVSPPPEGAQIDEIASKIDSKSVLC